MKTSTLLLIGSFVFAHLFSSGVCAAATASEPVGPVIELPPVSIIGEFNMPPPENWLYGRFGDFEVLSNASPRDTKKLLADFQKFNQALRILRFGGDRPLISRTIIICGAGRKYSDFTPSAKPQYNGDISLSLGDPEQAIIVLDLETRSVFSTDFIAELSGFHGGVPDLTVDASRQLYRAYIRQMLCRSEYTPPPWLLEGMSQIIMDIKHFGTWITYGKLETQGGSVVTITPHGEMYTQDRGEGNYGPGLYRQNFFFNNPLVEMDNHDHGDGDYGPSYYTQGYYFHNPLMQIPPAGTQLLMRDRQFNRVLKNRKLIPMGKFLTMSPDPNGTSNFLDNIFWAKQAYAFVHMCLFRRDGKFLKPYETFVKRLANEPLSEELFKECFAMSYAQMSDVLSTYIKFPYHKYRYIKLTKEGRLTASEVVLRAATEGEIGQIKGDAQRLAGRRDDALQSYRVAYARGAKEPRLLGSLGTEQLRLGKIEVAGKFLEAAEMIGSDRPSDHVALARQRLALALKTPDGPGGKLGPDQTALVIVPLLKARATQFDLPETYEVMAQAWMASVLSPAADSLAILGEGVLKFPFNSDLNERTARLYAGTGDMKNAAGLAQHGLRFASDDATRERFKILLAAFSSAAP